MKTPALRLSYEPNMGEVNFVAHAIAEIQSCGSCAGIAEYDRHCAACTEEATAALKALNHYRTSPPSGKQLPKKYATSEKPNAENR